MSGQFGLDPVYTIHNTSLATGSATILRTAAAGGGSPARGEASDGEIASTGEKRGPPEAVAANAVAGAA